MSDPAPSLRDARGHYVIDGPADATEQHLINLGATSIIHTSKGGFAGVYVDNETGTAALGSPEQLAQRDAIAKGLVKLLPGKLIVVGLYPKEVGHRIEGCICVLEWYPYYDYADQVTPPKGEQGYITQWDYAPSPKGPPTMVERCHLLSIVRAWNPAILWVF